MVKIDDEEPRSIDFAIEKADLVEIEYLKNKY